MLYAQPGDIVFVRGSALLSKAIRWAEREPGEAASWPNHVLTVVEGGYLVPPKCVMAPLAETIEALWHVEHTKWFERHGHEKCSVELWRTFQDNESVFREKEFLFRQVGNRYGWWKLFLILAQRFTRIPFKKVMFIKKRPICSVLSALGKAVGGVYFDREPFDCTPDNMHDFVSQSPEWILVGREHLNGGVPYKPNGRSV